MFIKLLKFAVLFYDVYKRYIYTYTYRFNEELSKLIDEHRRTYSSNFKN